MAKTNQIKKVVNGEIADADDVNQIVENAGNEGGGIPYDPTTHQKETDGSEHLGSTNNPWGSLFVNKNGSFVELDLANPTLNQSVLWSNLRRFITLKDAPNSYAGHGGAQVVVNSGETGLEFANPAASELFTSSGTWVCPQGVTKIYVSMCGGGGGGAGGGGGGGTGPSGGGSAANSLLWFPYTVIPGNSYTVTIGAAGAAGTGGTSAPGTDGTDGGNTSFDTLTCLGGKKGTATTAGTNTSISRNAHATNGTAGNPQELGGNGGLGVFNTNGGGGGASIFGAGGSGAGSGGGLPTGFGAGGASGQDHNPNPGENGSAGSQGFVAIAY